MPLLKGAAAPPSEIGRSVPGLALAVVCGAFFACGSPPAPGEAVTIGLLLSYSGPFAANSINSDRAVRMAVEAANAAGGVGGKPLRLVARDTRSTADVVARTAQELLDAGAVMFIGPDAVDIANELRFPLGGRTLIMPSFATAGDVNFGIARPYWWFVMGPGTERMACELKAQIETDQRKDSLTILNAGYNTFVAWYLTNRYGIPKYVLPADQSSAGSAIHPIVGAASDAYVLATFPPSGSALIYALVATGNLGYPSHWYLSPTLHTPAFLETIPKGALDGARGVAPGTIAGSADFRTAFRSRWHDDPLDDAYPFYDASAVAALAIERALNKDGSIPDGNGLQKHVLAVTHAGGTSVRWNEIGLGFSLLRRGQEISYVGLSGEIQFDDTGQPLATSTNTKWWTIQNHAFVDVETQRGCR